MLPIWPRDTRIMHLGRLDQKRLTMEHKRLIANSKRRILRRLSPGRHAKQERNGEAKFCYSFHCQDDNLKSDAELSIKITPKTTKYK